MMTQDEILDYLDRAYKSGCFPEVLKMIRSGSEKVLVEVVIKKAEERPILSDFDWKDIFGTD